MAKEQNEPAHFNLSLKKENGGVSCVCDIEGTRGDLLAMLSKVFSGNESVLRLVAEATVDAIEKRE